MKKKALRKDFYMEIKKSLGRFISIFLIVALGVAFFSGIQSAAPDMRLTGNTYFTEHQYMDLEVTGTMGITQKDVSAFKNMDQIREAEPAYSVDVLAGRDGENDVIHIESLTRTLNLLDVREGSLPKKIGECLLDARYAEMYQYKVGDTLEIREDVEEDEDVRLKTHTYIVSGIGSSPKYISFDRGSSSLSGGTVQAFAYVTDDNFDMDVYAKVYLLAEGSREYAAFSDEYKTFMDDVTKVVESMESERCKIRFQEVKGKADKELADAEKKLKRKTRKANEKLNKAKKKIEDASKKIEDGKQELAEARKKISDNKNLLHTKQRELQDAKKQLQDGENKLEDAKKKLQEQESSFKTKKKASNKKLKKGEEKLKTARKQIEKNEAELAKKRAELNAVKAQGAMGSAIEQAEAALAEGEKELKKAKAQVESKEAEMAEARQALADGEYKIHNAWTEWRNKQTELNDARKQIESASAEIARGWEKIANAEQQAEKGEKEIAEHEKELIDGQKEYDKGKKEADEKIADANAKLEDAKKEIDDLKMPKWYLTARKDNADYTGYGDNADRMRNIGRVFPVLFFLVAALISLTTMTRMVEEQRTQIGSLKALGYSKFAIASKYLGYAAMATIGGSVFGVLLGEKILPYIIIKAYGIMYPYMEGLEIPYNLAYGLTATVVAVLCTLVATVSSCYHELSAVPAALMRPPVPKKGKRVLLERLPFIWKYFSFIWKSTIRNLFRYKKRFFMTIFGIGGCMALLLVGYGLKDSILDVAVLQFDNLQFYDGMVIMDEEAGEKEKQDLNTFIAQEKGVTNFDDWYMKNATAVSVESSRDVYMVVPKDTEIFSKFVKLRDRKDKIPYELPEDGFVLTEKAAGLLDVEVGDHLKFEYAKGEWAEGEIRAITENYMYHYLYMSKEYYKEITGKEVEYNSLVFQTDTKDRNEIEDIGQKALTMDASLGISYTGTIEDRLNDMLKSMDLVMVVLIVSAGMLAFVVLYNLNNININERKRELATLKVLGFYDTEVSAYVYRENILLTVIGAGLGCIMGMLLHRFTIVTVEIDICMFGRTINGRSYLLAVLFTFGFSMAVNLIMYFKLKKIDMVESLKSVE